MKVFVLIMLCFNYLSSVGGHGLIQKPASREQFCGVETKPDQIFTKLIHPQCLPMLTNPDGSPDSTVYNFMSVLTHDTGRQNKTPDQLPKNVCGFNSEKWNGGKTPWDKALNWPVNSISPGTNQFVWNVVWGPHFSDTEEFVYWITTPSFAFQADQELSWSDFEDKPFCLLKFDPTNPSSNPKIVADEPNALFTTTCDVPARKGRAVIYGEWGRNKHTFERFHSCVDVTFGGSGVTDAPTSAPSPTGISPAPSPAPAPSKSTGTPSMVPAPNPVTLAPSPTTVRPGCVLIRKTHQPSEAPTEGQQGDGNCWVKSRTGNNAWYLGYDVYISDTPITLDFTSTGIDLRKINVDSAVFGDSIQVLDSHRLVINSKPDWVSTSNPGYIGFWASNYAPLASKSVAVCNEGS